MSGLSTDKFFRNAIYSDQQLASNLGGRIYNTARPDLDEEADLIPYVIITLESVVNDSTTKDDIDGLSDQATVSLLVVADNRESLASLTEQVREVVSGYWRSVAQDEDHPDRAICPDDWSFQAGRVEFDSEKPCLFQTLVYSCDINIY